jgi:biopolymer transport protein ExbD
MLIDGQLVDAASVRQHAGTERRVFIRGDGKVTYAQFMAAMKQLEGLNIPVLIGQKGPVQ